MKDKLVRSFKGIWFPEKLWFNEELSWMEKLFFLEIDSLDNDNGCFASNAHFAGFFKLSRNRCSEIINSLVKKGYISKQEIKKPGSKQIEKRILRCVRKIDYVVEKPIDDEKTIVDKSTTCSEKCEGSYILKINNNIYIDIYSGVIDYLNKKAGTKYKANTKSTQSLIHARLDEGFTEMDFVEVIDKKVADWKGTDYEKYLRPQTLFNASKFENYLNQKNSQTRTMQDYNNMSDEDWTNVPKTEKEYWPE